MWFEFTILVILLLAIDLFVFNRKAHTIKVKEALWLSLFWIGIAFAFNTWLYVYEGKQKAMEFLAGYLIEKSLSVDNLFVFIVIFSYFKVEGKYQHKILYWGIIGALVMRAVFILAGVSLIQRFSWITYVFGAFLIYTGFKLARGAEGEVDPGNNVMVKLATKIFPFTTNDDHGSFFVKTMGRWAATPLFLVLLVVETTDVVFAVDSIPAVLAVSHDPFIVFSSNVFAILGLRALYFALAGVMNLFYYLKYGLAIVLSFVGVKMMIAHHYKIPIVWALGIVIGTLALSIVASLLFPKKEPLP